MGNVGNVAFEGEFRPGEGWVTTSTEDSQVYRAALISLLSGEDLQGRLQSAISLAHGISLDEEVAADFARRLVAVRDSLQTIVEELEVL